MSAREVLARCLLLDLETRGSGEILKIGAVFGSKTFERKGKFLLGAALVELERFAQGADAVLGHNLLGHDLVVLRRLAPSLFLHDLPVVDTLKLPTLGAARTMRRRALVALRRAMDHTGNEYA